MSNPVSLGKTGATSRILASGANRAAFTLIELSLVLLLVGILMTIAIGLTQSVTERGRRSRAETELAVIAAA
ncbi:MAG: prepilin-type N-terminal cleavage/methylation domain-containing protein, partial [Verrucomicrobia bacterium]